MFSGVSSEICGIGNFLGNSSFYDDESCVHLNGDAKVAQFKRKQFDPPCQKLLRVHETKYPIEFGGRQLHEYDSRTCLHGTTVCLCMFLFLCRPSRSFFHYVSLQDYVRSVRAKLKERGTPQPEIKEFMAQAPGIVK